MARLALVDDDRNIVESLSVFFTAEGFEVVSYNDSLLALEGMGSDPPDLAILDIKMPRVDGMELFRRLRQNWDIPVIFLTSKDDEIDEFEGLNLGADDYVRKPCSNRLLAERVKAVLRRSGANIGEEDNLVRRGRMILDMNRHLCNWGGRLIRLTVTEFLILKSLVERPGHVKSRDQLMDSAYDDQIYVDDRTIDSHIKRIRRKFRATDPGFDGIETLYGVGYCYRDKPAEE